jgi:hypothetical protein
MPDIFSPLYAGSAAEVVKPIASAYFRYVSTDATTTLASMVKISIPIKEILAQASMTIPLSRTLSSTSTRLEDAIDFSTGIFVYSS